MRTEPGTKDSPVKLARGYEGLKVCSLRGRIYSPEYHVILIALERGLKLLLLTNACILQNLSFTDSALLMDNLCFQVRFSRFSFWFLRDLNCSESEICLLIT